MLREFGYGVVTAANGAEALRAIIEQSAIRLLLTDVGLPGGMDGTPDRRCMRSAHLLHRPGAGTAARSAHPLADALMQKTGAKKFYLPSPDYIWPHVMNTKSVNWSPPTAA
jgi:CheY-like chemotaxis protein